MVLVLDGQVDCLKQNGMVTIVLVDMLCDFNILVDSFDLPIDRAYQFCIIYWWREELNDLEDFNLQPRAWCHVIVVVLSVFLHVRKDCHQLRQ